MFNHCNAFYFSTLFFITLVKNHVFIHIDWFIEYFAFVQISEGLLMLNCVSVIHLPFVCLVDVMNFFKKTLDNTESFTNESIMVCTMACFVNPLLLFVHFNKFHSLVIFYY